MMNKTLLGDQLYDWSVLTIYNSDEERTFTVMSDVNSV